MSNDVIASLCPPAQPTPHMRNQAHKTSVSSVRYTIFLFSSIISADLLLHPLSLHWFKQQRQIHAEVRRHGIQTLLRAAHLKCIGVILQINNRSLLQLLQAAVVRDYQPFSHIKYPKSLPEQPYTVFVQWNGLEPVRHLCHLPRPEAVSAVFSLWKSVRIQELQQHLERPGL